MAYTVINFKTKKALKEMVAEYHSFGGCKYINDKPRQEVRCFQPGLGPDLSIYTGRIVLEGPHYPQAHTWYADAELKDGVVIKVR